MSVINQVLSDLEKRGATVLSGETAIRPVPVRRSWRTGWTIILLIMLAVAVAGWWWSERPMFSSPLNPAPVISPELILSPVITPIVTPAAPIAQDAQSERAGENTSLPPMRLSYELSVIPQEAVNEQTVTKKNIPVAVDKAPPEAPVQTGSVDKQMKQVSPQQRAENEFRRASGLIQQGRSNEAIAGYEAALKIDSKHEAARQAMAGLLLEDKRNADAERILDEGLKINPRNTSFAILLARLQVERSELPLAMETLQKTLPYAEQRPDYYAFVAAIYQRQNRHKEAIMHYQIALKMVPNSGVWLMGLGISLQAVDRIEEARDVFKRAINSQTLNEELQMFVTQRMKAL